MNKKILIICDTKLSSDPRVLRQFQALKNNYTIDTLGKSPIGEEDKFYSIKYSKNSLFRKLLGMILLVLRAYPLYHQIASKQLKIDAELVIDYDLIIANDLEMVPLCLTLSNKEVPVWTDLHEYAPGQVENDWVWRTFFKPYKKWICNKYLKECKAISTVCESIGKKYSEEFRVKVDEIILNVPDYNELSITPTNPENIKIVHHGAAIPRRHLDTMIDVLDYLPKQYELNLLLVANNERMRNYKVELENYAKKKTTKINFIDPVATVDIPKTINQYDIGLFILKPVNFNYTYALPNKFFEFIQGRLAIAVSPNYEMKKIVEKYDLGIVSKAFTAKSMAEAILDINDLERHKKNAADVSHELSAIKVYEQIQTLVKSII